MKFDTFKIGEYAFKTARINQISKSPRLRNERTSAMVITHYQRMLDYLQPDYVHVLVKGRIVREGTKQLGYEIEEKGFDWIINEAEA